MRIERLVYWVVIVSLAAGVLLSSQKRSQAEAETAALKAELEKLRAGGRKGSSQQAAEEEKSRAQTVELMKLRNEITQLRADNRTAETLRGENDQLRRQLANAPKTTNSQQSDASAAPQPRWDTMAHFPREQWAFAGYDSPQAALVSAIWAMKEGQPGTYLASLSPGEAERMAKVWENKTEAEIVAKHQGDVSAITGMRLLEQQEVSPNELQMNVYLQGPGRVEKIRMLKAENEWRFGGFIRPPAPP